MEFNIVTESASAWSADAVIFFAFKDSEEHLSGFSSWMASDADWVAVSPALSDFSGELGSSTVIYGSGSSVQRVLLVGLGEEKEFGVDKFLQAVSGAFQRCRELKFRTVGVPLAAFEGIALEDKLEHFVVAAIEGLYSFDEFKSKKDEKKELPEAVRFLSEDEPPAHLAEMLAKGQAVGLGMGYARDLVNLPPNVATPVYLADEAKKMAKKFGFKFKVMKRKEIIDKGMGAYASVFRGSNDEPRMIILEYCPKDREGEKPLVLVGKGVTFDTGGISLKPTGFIEDMKCDMAGAAAILGFFQAIGEIKPDLPIVGILPCADNMPDANSTRPGEVVTSFSGKTIEILNTDAEGRLLLCDALAFSAQYEPAAIIDIATLTGGCIVAFGWNVAAVMDNSPLMQDLVMESGKRVGERFWPMPLWDIYKEELKSEVADLKNVGSREGMTIHAGMFLKEFVPEDTPWAHLDIAGPAWRKKKSPAGAAGGTGFGVRTLVELAERIDLEDM
ncbi:leucyl aminopeptidase [Maridesulfovibrio salexigens]|uniref:Probable cytosol aminopeptidase n=1 Tax=Maridesulfovibrio salexigens (strain ATCC 14822 / DSM 2638 / NCIMB 8403 / VKM B-1763) TaxID=526222 RepID=C6C244_MARSD|nr:leucyl aminopeptidase [Maridesulfovibrio salexigens]ACS81245.1 Leucyl aminopeptidase [Maridesulfovibrio salexigens DSM 2638]